VLRPGVHLTGGEGIIGCMLWSSTGEQLAGQVSSSICWRSRALNAWIVRAAS
jgi:hypothetical protein